MAAPKKKHSQQRQRKRRTHDNAGIQYKLLQEWEDSDKEKEEFFRGHNLPGMSRCPRCNHVRKPHRVCGNCGQYGDESLIDVE